MSMEWALLITMWAMFGVGIGIGWSTAKMKYGGYGYEGDEEKHDDEQPLD